MNEKETNDSSKSKGIWGKLCFENAFIKVHLAHKLTCLFGLVGFIIMLGYIIAHRNLYLNTDPVLYYGKTLYTLSILGAVLIGIISVVRIQWPEKFRPIWNTIIFFLMPFVTMQITELLNCKFIANFATLTFWLNYFLFLFIYMIFFLFSRSYKIPILIINPGLYLCALVNYYVELFRGSPFIPTDLLSMGTGLSVADGYEYDIICQMILASVIMIFAVVVGGLIKGIRVEKKRGKIIIRLIPLAYIIIFFLFFWGSNALPDMGYKPDFWNQKRGYHKTGSIFNFALNTKYLVVSKPDGYNADNVSSLLYSELEEAGVDPDGDTSINILTGENDYTPTDYSDGQQPNIICIMNESLADLSLYGDTLETSEDLLPFIHSLEENTIKGTLYMPVFGAGTSNSEYEFLTGNTISFFPSGCNVYQTYINSEQPSLVSTVSEQGYGSPLAYHPYYGDGWRREIVYPDFGFVDYISIEDFVDQDILDTYKANNNVNEYEDLLKERYPDRNMLLRRFVSDSYDYQMVEEMYENRDSSEPFFIFNVTMQNHGGYAVDYRNFYKPIKILSPSTDYPAAERYVNLAKRSDDAFKELVEYFSNVDEPTIIVMFGDHQPSLETEFYEELLGKSLDELDLEELQKRYETPFVIWANYDIPEATIEKMSSNYLSTLALQVAGLELTDYNKYLAALYQKLPVINTNGYVDADGNYYSYDDDSEYETDLNIYSQLCYYNQFEKEADESIFYLGEDE